MKQISLAIFLTLIMSSSTFCAESSPNITVGEFYKWAIRHSSGLPKESELKSLKKFLSIDLVYLLHASLAAEERCAAGAPPDIKPRMFEGSIFVGNYEGFTKVILLSEKKVGENIIVSARLEYTDPKFPTNARDWLDTITLIHENDMWVISDIVIPGSKQTLVEALKKYISKEECGI